MESHRTSDSAMGVVQPRWSPGRDCLTAKTLAPRPGSCLPRSLRTWHCQLQQRRFGLALRLHRDLVPGLPAGDQLHALAVQLGLEPATTSASGATRPLLPGSRWGGRSGEWSSGAPFMSRSRTTLSRLSQSSGWAACSWHWRS